MPRFFDAVDAFMEDYFNITIPSISPTDVVEIIIIAFFLYVVMQWIKNTRAWTLFKGVLVVVGLFVVAALFQMHTLLWLGGKLANAAYVLLIVVFQKELRDALERLGRGDFIRNLFTLNASAKFSDRTLNDLVKACYEMGAVKTGALIVVQNSVGLNEYERTGIELDSLLSRQLLINIFEKNTPLHDGAVIVVGDRVTAATCYLPLSDNYEVSKELGTRHRAALGLSEVCDALTIVVSEETGKVSIAKEGKITRDITPEELTAALKELQVLAPEEREEKRRGSYVDED